MNKKIAEKKEGLITTLDYKRTSVKISYWLIFATLIVISVISLFPIIFSFLSGFKEVSEYYSSEIKILPKNISMKKIKDACKLLNVGKSFINTLIMFAGSWFSEICIGGIAGYTLSRLKPKGGSFLFKLMLWTMLMPQTLSMVPLFLTWIDFPIFHWNFQNTYIPFWVSSMGNVFDIMLFKNFFDKIPNSYIEAAKLEGCTNVGIFTRIIVPLSKPIISTISIFVFSGSWNNFLMPFLLIKDTTKAPIALKLYLQQAGMTEPEQMLSAFIVMLPVIVVFMLFSKQIYGNNLSVGVKE